VLEKILVVDDEDIVLDIIEKILIHAGYQIVAVKSAKDALEICSKDKDIPLVLTDIHLGQDMDGISLCSRLKYLDSRKVIVGMTGYLDKYPLEYCLSIGFRDMLLKPIEYQDLIDSIECNLKYQKRLIKYSYG